MLRAGGAGRGTNTVPGTGGCKSVFGRAPGLPEQRCLLGGARIRARSASLGGSRAGIVPVWDGWQHSRGCASARAGARGGARAHRPVPEQPDWRGWFGGIGSRAGLSLLPCSRPSRSQGEGDPHGDSSVTAGLLCERGSCLEITRASLSAPHALKRLQSPGAAGTRDPSPGRADPRCPLRDPAVSPALAGTSEGAVTPWAPRARPEEGKSPGGRGAPGSGRGESFGSASPVSPAAPEAALSAGRALFGDRHRVHER